MDKRDILCRECDGLGFKVPSPYTLLTINAIEALRQRPCSHCNGTGKEPT